MTVIRDVVIRARVERSGGGADGSAGGKFESRAYAAEARAAAEAGREVTKAHKEAGKAMVGAFREGGEGAMRAGRGIALFAAAGEDDMRKLQQQVVGVVGAFDVLSGSAKVGQALAMAMGPVGYVVAGVTTALGLGAAAWHRYENAGKEAAKQKLESMLETRRLLEETRALEERRAADRESIGGERIANIRDPQRRRAALLGAAEDSRRDQSFNRGREIFERGFGTNRPDLAQIGINVTRQSLSFLRSEIDYRKQSSEIDQEIYNKRIEAIRQAEQQLEEAKSTPSLLDDGPARSNFFGLTGGQSAVTAVADLRSKNNAAVAQAESTIDRLLAMLRKMQVGVEQMEDRMDRTFRQLER